MLLYSFVGVELPTAAAEEMRDPRRDIPVAIARAGVGQALMYGVPIVAVLVVLPPAQITSLHGLIDAMRTVFTVYGGDVAADGSVTLTGAGSALGWLGAWLFIWVLLASGSAWIIGAGRAQAAACLDGGGPRVLGRISARTGVPVVMGLVSGAVSLAAMALDLWLTDGDGQKYFSVGPDRVDRPDRAGVPADLPSVPRPASTRAGPRAAVPGARRAGGGVGRDRAGDRMVAARHCLSCCGRASARRRQTRTCRPASRVSGWSSSCWHCRRSWPS